ncbi:MAG: type II toxin-antitoxin system VapC family toxin [Gemmatimonadota bacterium]|nr:type II toxin-antitoxin system VapC family toxin [Gemmatimonadota bacterium]MDE2864202.1 type II toxin-antitoxin system VapC family toxin [Gemmatimonadota bacterium]MYB07866.1 type II toxin-antitoxin system VapC family toxin [Gemmatimonadota bacterium]MYE15898.1 type II toxin-antitoxin system VapC family toxin [Gemmatimonadota bacterium]MYG24024.1 type II toxin-antitoxin system VapC family toxin [Gemmatimonadota bacterium]
MAWLLDTNVVSEMMRRHPEPRVARFLDRAGRNRLHISAITIWEIHNGIGLLDSQSRRADLAARFEQVLNDTFEDRILHWTAADARECARVMEKRRRLGAPLDQHLPDAMLAASAASHSLTLVTRNTRDFRLTDIKVFNPWKDVSGLGQD